MKASLIVIHHSASSPDITLEEIDRAHRDRGFTGVGYHYLVTLGGEVVSARPENIEGAHARGANRESLGICCLGNFEEQDIPSVQFDTLVSLVIELARRYQIQPDQIIAHCDVIERSENATKTLCPGKHLHAKLPLLRKRVEAALKPNYRGSSVTFINSTDGFLKISGILKGRHYERSVKRSRTAPDWVRIVLRSREGQIPAWRGRAIVRPNQAEGGGVNFSLSVPQRYLTPGRYECSIFLEEEPCLFEDVEPLPQLQYFIDLPIDGERVFSIPAMRADVFAHRIQGTGPFVVRVKGTVINTGTCAWINDNDLCPFRVGAIVLDPDGQPKPLMELRYDLPYTRIEVGQEVPFSFTFDTGDLPLGEYYVHVDVVRERCFWFTEVGGVGDSVRFEVAEHRNQNDEDVTHLLSPPNSWANLPHDARVLYVAPTLPLFDRATGGRRLLDMFRVLRERGVEITYLYEQLGAFTETEKYTRVLDELGIQHAPDPIGYLTELGDPQRFHLVILGWYYTAAAVISSVRDALPGVRIAIDSNDIHWERELRSEQAGLLDKTPQEREADKARERRVYAQADEVWVVSEDEAAILARELPATKWRVVGIPCPESDAYVNELKGDRILFVGGFGHLPNESAALWAADIVSEFNARSGRSVHLDIVGSQPPLSVRELANNPLISVPGFVPSLDEHHSNAKVFLAPLKYGGGVKGKISDAICRGVPVITNALGNEGLRLRHGKEILLAETTEDFIQILSDVYAGKYNLDEIRVNALRRLQNLYGDKALCAQMLSALVAPPVVIGIVTYNKKEMLKACLTSILEKTSYKNFKIAVISNGCTDGTVEYLHDMTQWYPNVIDAICSKVNNFFVRPCNDIIGRYPESDIVLMNNDVEVINPGWLTNLVDAAYSSREVCGSGGLIFDPSGTISEAGAEIYTTGMGRNLYRGAQSVTGAALAIRPVGFVSGCLMYMRRDAIQTVGALDDEYHPMYFEDVAWHYTAHTQGLKTIYTPWARATHNEGSSAGQDVSKGMKRYQEINRKKFLEKFSGIDFERFNYSD
jgi:GT2 family glycosyltransferase